MKIILSFLLVLVFLSVFGYAETEHERKGRVYLAAIKAVYNLTIYPNNNYVIRTGILPDVMNANIKARVFDFAIELTSPLDVAEYFYGLTPNNYTYETITVAITRVNFNRFLWKGKFAFTSINYVTTNLATGVTSNGTQIGQWRFDDDDKIIEIDNFQPYYAHQITESVGDPTNPFYRAFIVDQVCSRHQLRCTGANQQYPSYAACSAYVSSLTFGTPWFNQWNSTTCRWWHSYLTALRPNIHCPHVGPTGGGVCVDYKPASLYTPFFPGSAKRLIGPETFVTSVF